MSERWRDSYSPAVPAIAEATLQLVEEDYTEEDLFSLMGEEVGEEQCFSTQRLHELLITVTALAFHNQYGSTLRSC